MHETIVAVDMDDVVIETASSIIQHLNIKYGANASIDNFYSRDPSVWSAPDIETAVDRVNDFLNTDEYFESAPVQETIHALRRLKEYHKLYIVTGRPDFTELATRKWLEEHLPDLFENVVFSNYFDSKIARNKGSLCKELGATVLIDDHIDHCKSALECGVRPLLFGSYPWNNAVDLPVGIQRVMHWADVEKELIPN